MNKKRWTIVVVIIVLAGLGYAGYRIWHGASAQQTAAEAVAAETAVVRRGTLQVTVSASGSVVPNAEVSLAFLSGGRIVEVLVQEGQQIQAGQALARLETGDLEAQVAQAEASLTMAETGVASAQASLTSAQAKLDQLLAGPSEHEIEMAKLRVDQARDSLWAAQVRRDAVKGNPQASQADIDAQEAAVLQAEDALRIAEVQYEQTVAGPTEEDVAIARAQVEQAQAQLESAQAKVEQAQASLEQAKLRLAQATLIAPMDGTVTAVNIHVGEMASAGKPAIVLSDLADLAVDINLDESDVVRVKIGQKVRVTLDAFPDVELIGEVTYIAPVAQTQAGVVLYPVTISLAPSASSSAISLRAGMTADVDIIVASRENALIVPLRAIRSIDGQSFVLRATSGSTSVSRATAERGQGRGVPGQKLAVAGFEAVRVQLGLMNDTEVEIISGLAEGDVVSVAAIPSREEMRAGPTGMFGVMRGLPSGGK